MSRFRIARFAAVALGVLLLAPVQSQTQQPRRKRVLAWCDAQGGYQHDSISHAAAVIERLGRESGAYDTFIRTDSQWITKQAIPEPARNTHNLDYFDAIFYFGVGDPLNAQQRKDLIAFIKDEGKGFVGAHTGDDAFFDWPEFGEMIGGYFDQHPWNTFNAPVVIEDRAFPGMKLFPERFNIVDEIYQHKNWSRDKVHVLASLDASKLDFSKPNIRRTDKDFAVAWAKMYGKGRVFYSSFGHTVEAWDDARIQHMYHEALRWVLRQVGDDVTPGPARK